ncbi:AAEL010023-PA [Aedes aegypti]|uniref:AAEL010023-PA n=1 Tax=Aedes aegypti TaxID=7159 RepID=Q16U33_AEDAE|nr:AAEL010023-PA [Aedes aegypti]
MDRDKNDTSSNTGLAGGFAGCITRFICQPLDVLKIRFQLQVEPLSEDHMTSKYRTIVQSTRLVYKEEGLRAFWKGHNPAQVLSIIYGVSQFSSYEHTNFFLRQFEPFERHQNARNFFCGALSGTVATVITLPLDVHVSTVFQHCFNGNAAGGRAVHLRRAGRDLYKVASLSPGSGQEAPADTGIRQKPPNIRSALCVRQHVQLYVQHSQAGRILGPVQGSLPGVAKSVLHVGLLLCDLRRDGVDIESLIDTQPAPLANQVP